MPTTLTRDRFQMHFDPTIEPVATVPSGSTVVFEAEDSHCGAIRSDERNFTDNDAIFEEFGGLNPVTGPLFVEGAEPGGALTVDILDIRVAPVWGKAYSSRTPEGALEPPYTLRPSLEPRTRIFELEDGALVYPSNKGPIKLPLKPMVGTIGVAPQYERRMSFAQGADFLGNVDVPDLGIGASVVLPVHHPGALLSLGDSHGRQGDGEISGGGIEIQADVEVRVTASSREEAGFAELPQLNTEDWIGSIASFGGVTLGDNVRAAYVDLVKRLQRYHGFELLDAYELLGHVGTVQVGTMNDPEYSALARVERRYLG
jgi:amidase